MDEILGWFLVKPQRLMGCGRVLSLAGFALLIAGFWGQVATSSVNAISHMVPGAAAQPAKTLAEIYPAMFIWWIPESWPGYLLAVGLIALGVVASMTGKQYMKMLGMRPE